MIQWLNGHNWGYIPHLLSTGLIIILSHKHSGGIPWVYHGILHFQTQVFFIFSDPTSHDSRLLLERSFDQSISALESMTWVWHGLTVRYSQIRWVSYGFVIVFPIHIANFWGSSPISFGGWSLVAGPGLRFARHQNCGLWSVQIPRGGAMGPGIWDILWYITLW